MKFHILLALSALRLLDPVKTYELGVQLVLVENVMSKLSVIVFLYESTYNVFMIVLELLFASMLCSCKKNDKRETRDPPRLHPETVFIPETEVKMWENYVMHVRECRKAPPWPTSADDGYKEDGHGRSLKVPSSVLDGCEQSFTAVDGERQKASTQFFDSTALMGMLCQHDRVLWLVNMTSLGGMLTLCVLLNK